MTGPNGANWRRIPKTGAAQLVEIRETVKEVVRPGLRADRACRRAEARRRDEAYFRRLSDDELLGYGVPAEWLDDVEAGDRGHAA